MCDVQRVQNLTPSHLHLHGDNAMHTTRDLLEREHDYMVKDAKEWVKQTAQSFSVVAVLVATMVFAAAYTMPSGIEGGSALLLKTPMFIFFTIMNIMAIAFSLASMVMFLSIFNSSFDLWDFHKSLPCTVRTGSLFLFLSLISMMLGFSAAILITIRLQWKQPLTLVYGAAFFFVTTVAMIKFPIRRFQGSSSSILRRIRLMLVDQAQGLR